MQQATAQAGYCSAVDAVAVRAALLGWYRVHKRDLPWRRTGDPYAIWVSETMLQQTRVTAVLPYFARFMQEFPTIDALAEAPEAELLACWAGLGYYTRVRNMQRAAKQMKAGFPDTYAAILELPGVGDYTAAAVASIAFGLPHAVVDGNVLRVLSRLYADATDIAQPAGKKHFAALADKLLDHSDPGDFNQALMELGATVCLPKNPQCLLCPVAEHCLARRVGAQSEFPVKKLSKRQVCEERTVFWVERDSRVLAWQRGPQERLMAGFWELPEREHLPEAVGDGVLGSFRHGITFHDYRFHVVQAKIPANCAACQWVELDQLKRIPVSTIFRKALRVVRSAASAIPG